MLIAMSLAMATALIFQIRLMRAGVPLGFLRPWRAAGAGVLLMLFFFLGVFVPAALIDRPPEVDVEALTRLDLFTSQLLMLAVLAGWALFAFGEPLPKVADDERPQPAASPPLDGMVEVARAEAPDPDLRRDWIAFFGLHTQQLATELRVGVIAGAAAWAAVIAVLMVVGGLIGSLGGDAALGAPAVSPLIVYLAGLPVIWRLALSVAAGVVEEIFYRGFLQPRLGLGLSTVCFVLGHATYGQPMMLVGLTVLSLLYGLLVQRRGNVWAAIVAHTLFDAVQLLVVVPAALETLP